MSVMSKETARHRSPIAALLPEARQRLIELGTPLLLTEIVIRPFISTALFRHDPLECLDGRLYYFPESSIVEDCDALGHQAFVGREQFGGARKTDIG